MIQILPQSEALAPSSYNPAIAVEEINSYIETNHCKTMNIDISFMNVIDSCYITTLCSTTHYMKYPDGKINWKISSEEIKELNSSLDLGNSTYEI